MTLPQEPEGRRRPDRAALLIALFLAVLAGVVLWDASRNRQTSYSDPVVVYRDLAAIGLEAPESMERALSRGFKPQGGRR